MTDNNLTTMNGLVKRVYGKGVHKAVPDNVKPFFDAMPFVPNQERIGEKFVESVTLGVEQGVTFMSGTAGIVSLSGAISGKNVQAIVDASGIVMQGTLSWDLVAKASQTNGAASFERSVTTVTDNTLISHRRYQAMQALYGTDNIGVISAGAASATQTITAASCAQGAIYGNDNMLVDIYDPTLVTKRNGSALSLTGYSVDQTGSSRTLTFGTSVTTTTGDVVVPSGWVSSGAYVHGPGLSTIASQTGGTLFSINQATYPMFAGSTYDAGSASLTLAKLDQATILPLTRGYSGGMTLFCNPRTFSNLSLEETARVQLVNGNATGTAKIGFKKVQVQTASGADVTIIPSPWIKEGEAYITPNDGTLRRIGAVDIKLGGPMGEEPWQRLVQQTGYYLESYSLQAPFTAEPWKLVKIKNITNT